MPKEQDLESQSNTIEFKFSSMTVFKIKFSFHKNHYFKDKIRQLLIAHKKLEATLLFPFLVRITWKHENILRSIIFIRLSYGFMAIYIARWQI